MSELRSFPNGRLEALTMLYLQKQNPNSPEELVDMYRDARDRINNRLKETEPNHNW